jgi:hypothetical protein
MINIIIIEEINGELGFQNTGEKADHQVPTNVQDLQVPINVQDHQSRKCNYAIF